MKSLSPQTITDLTELLRPETFWERLQGREAHLLTVITRIRHQSEPGSIQYLALVVVLDHRSALQIAALEAIDHLLSYRSPDEIVRLVDGFRHVDYRIVGDSWNSWAKITPHHLEGWQALGPGSRALFAVLTGHCSGFIRQTATTLLARSNAPYVIPLLKVRLNDWVNEVREAANRAIAPRLASNALPSLLPFLPILEDLRRCGRSVHGDLLDQLHIRFRSPEARQVLLDGCAHPDRRVRWWCFQIRFDCEQAVPLRLEVLKLGDVAMRRSVAAAILAEAQSSDPSPYLDLLLADRFMSVRRDGLLVLAAWSGAQALDRMKPFMTDHNATIREFARYYVGKWSHAAQIVEYYRTLLAFGARDRLVGCLAGLGDVGDVHDIERITPYTNHQRPAVRRVAFIALDRLVALEDIQPFFPALKDPSSRIRQVVAAALGRRSKELSVDDLLSRFSIGSEHEQRTLMLVIRYLNELDRLAAYLMVSANMSSPFRKNAAHLALKIVQRTVNGYIGFSAHSPTLKRVAFALNGVESKLGDQVKDYIRALTGILTWPQGK